MGQIITLNCEKCNNNIELMEGQGIRDNDLDRVLVFFDKNIGSRIRLAVASSENTVWSFEKKIALCQRTGNIKAVPVILAGLGADKQVSFAGCDCGGDHVFYDTDKILDGSVMIECPVCKARMAARLSCMWD